jgi:aspartoacylase
LEEWPSLFACIAARLAQADQECQRMGQGRVLVVAGTHGNERNAPWLLEQWRQQPQLLDKAGLALQLEIGNPDALAANRRYIDHDLNRCFRLDWLNDPARQEREVQRARQLLDRFGPQAPQACPVVIDLHSTTSAMGNSLVVYGRRPADLALAAGVQARLGLPLYLHEADRAQTGFMLERWPAGLVIEVGPVPQGVLNAAICRQTQLALEAALATLAQASAGALRLPRSLQVHVHRGSLDLPRCAAGRPTAAVHPLRQGRDWQPIAAGDHLFWLPSDGSQGFAPQEHPGLDEEALWPVFINEAAYGEKGIALSLCRRELWPVQSSWAEALQAQFS